MRLMEGKRGLAETPFSRLYGGFILIALGLGGAGQGYPLLEMTIQLVALGVLAMGLGPSGTRWSRPLRALVVLWAATAVLMALQLLPLPPSWWQELPGRAIAAQIDTAVGQGVWRPFSLTPDKTAGALLALLPPLAGLVGCVTLRGEARRGLAGMVAMVALAAALLGILQFAGPGDAPLFPFVTAHRGLGVGLFVNRNHQACFLLAAMPLALVAVMQAKEKLWRMLGMAGMLVLAMGVVVTVSRSGLFLLPFVLMALLVQGGALHNRLRLAGALAALMALIWMAPAFQLALSRFSVAGEDSRIGYWQNTLFLLKEVLPWGTGLGSFSQLYASIEPLAQVQVLYVEHAHNDWLEWLAETGWPGAVLLLALPVAIVVAYRQTLRDGLGHGDRIALTHAGLTGVLVMAASSITDFPLRMPALGVFFGVCLGLVVPSTRGVLQQRSALGSWLARVTAVALAIPVLQWGLGHQALQGGDARLATRIAPWLAKAWSERASDRQVAGDAQGARLAALRALRIEPMDPAAVRNLGWARLSGGDEAGGTATMLAAAQLGWRDPVLQAWLVEQGLAHGNDDVVLHGVDALLRTGAPADQLYTLLRSLVPDAQARPALVETLAEQPGWRRGFLNQLAEDVPARFPAIEGLLVDLARAGSRADENETALMRWRAGDAGQFAQVARLWALAGEQGLIGHPRFDLASDALPAMAPPLAWRAPAVPGVSVNLVSEFSRSSGKSIEINSDGIAGGAVLGQTLALVPGNYLAGLTLSALDDKMLPGLALSCLPTSAGRQAQPLALTWRRGADGQKFGLARFSIDAMCQGQDLVLILPSSQGQHLAYSVTALRIDRVMATGANPENPNHD